MIADDAASNRYTGIEPLLDTVFSFLRRKTDFFAGPPGSENGTEAAIEKVNEVLQKHAKRYQAEKAKTKTTTTTSSKKKTVSKKVPAKKAEDVIEMGKDGGFDISDTEPTKKAAPKIEPAKKQETKVTAAAAATANTGGSTTADTPKKKDVEKDGTDSDKEKPPPVGNGGTVPGKYVWTQTLSELAVNIPVPENTRGRDLNVTIARSHLKAGLRGQTEMIVDAPLTKTIICDDSFWTVEDGNRLVINLQKLNQMEWWDSVCKGDPTIDVTKINPESSSLSDLDGETRKTVEKVSENTNFGNVHRRREARQNTHKNTMISIPALDDVRPTTKGNGSS